MVLSALTASRPGLGALFALCVAATGCAADAPGPSGAPGPGPGGAGAPSGTAGSGPGPGVEDVNCALPRELVRLPNRRIGRAIADLLHTPVVPTMAGGGGRSDTLVAGDTPLLPLDLAFEYGDVISTAAGQADAAQLLACSPGEAEAACVDRFIVAFTTRAFRRPIT